MDDSGIGSELFEWLPLYLQTSDALFPTGAYAHSFGLEESVRLGLITDERSLERFIQVQIVPALRHFELPYLRFVSAVIMQGDFDELCAIDREISTWKIAAEPRRASIQLGTRRLKALRTIAPSPLIDSLISAIGNGQAHGHHITVFALQTICANAPAHAGMIAYCYLTVSGVCSAALKLIRIGQDACQRVIRSVCREINSMIHASLDISREDVGWFNPVMEIAGMRHERAQERLFIS